MAVARQSQPDQNVNAAARGGGLRTPPQRLLSARSALALHAVDMFGTRKGAGTHVGGVALDRRLDHRAEIAVTANEFRRLRRQAEHILQHQYLAIARRTGA